VETDGRNPSFSLIGCHAAKINGSNIFQIKIFPMTSQIYYHSMCALDRSSKEHVYCGTTYIPIENGPKADLQPS
jgi:hypothetical protein